MRTIRSRREFLNTSHDRLTVLPQRGALVGVAALVLLGATPIGPAHAVQTPVAPAAGVVSAMRVAYHVNRLATDSMQAHVTPSSGLERRAQYVAAEFRRLGLKPAGDTGGWFQRYPIPGQKRVDLVKSRALLVTNAPVLSAPIVAEDGNFAPWRPMEASFATMARIVAPPGVMVAFTEGRSVVLLTGRHRVADLRAADVCDKVVLYVPPLDEDSLAKRQMTDTLRALARLVVLADDQDSAHTAGAAEPARRDTLSVTDSYLGDVAGNGNPQWMLAVRTTLLVEFVARAGGDLAGGRAIAAPMVQELPRTRVVVSLFFDEEVRNPVTAPNVVGVLEGTDPKLKDQYVVVSARLDDAPGAGTDGAAGTAGLLALAEAFRQSGVPLRRSLVFLAWSGGGSAGWGNNFFAQNHLLFYEFGLAAHLAVALRGPVSSDTTDEAVANKAVDTVTIDGLADVKLPPTWMAAHPELGIRAGSTVFDPTSPSFAFARRVVPTLSFHTGRTVGVKPKRVTDLLQLMYSIGETMANANERPRWSAEGLRELAALREP